MTGPDVDTQARWRDIFEQAEMRWVSVEDAEVTVRARDVAEMGRELAALAARLQTAETERDEARATKQATDRVQAALDKLTEAAQGWPTPNSYSDAVDVLRSEIGWGYQQAAFGIDVATAADAAEARAVAAEKERERLRAAAANLIVLFETFIYNPASISEGAIVRAIHEFMTDEDVTLPKNDVSSSELAAVESRLAAATDALRGAQNLASRISDDFAGTKAGMEFAIVVGYIDLRLEEIDAPARAVLAGEDGQP